MKILLTGTSGQVGFELFCCLQGLADICITSRNPGRQSFPSVEMDLQNPDSITAALRQVKPDLVLNPAAYTAVDKAESEPGIAEQVNHHAVAVMAEYANQHSIPLVHFSTDYVFNGNADRPYIETDPVSPLGVYGESKWRGEQALLASGASGMILRTSWVYGMRGKNFLNTMIRLASERDNLSVVNDQIGSPNWARYLAGVTTHAVFKALSKGQLHEQCSLYHLSSSGACSWYEFAAAIFQHATETGLIARAPTLQAITTDQYPTPAKRPAWSVLDTTKLQQDFDLEIPSWHDLLKLCIDSRV